MLLQVFVISNHCHQCATSKASPSKSMTAPAADGLPLKIAASFFKGR